MLFGGVGSGRFWLEKLDDWRLAIPASSVPLTDQMTWLYDAPLKVKLGTLTINPPSSQLLLTGCTGLLYRILAN